MGRTRGDDSKREGKRPMRVEEDPGESPPVMRKLSNTGDVGRAKPTQKKGEKATVSNPTPSAIYKGLMDMPFKGTKYPDHELLEELGILEDVSEIFSNLGAERWFNRSYPSHQEETCQFLSSLKITVPSTGEIDTEKDGFGYIKFKVHNKGYRMSFKRLGEVLGFDDGTGPGSRLDVRKTELERLWGTIGTGYFKTGKWKSKFIRHPGIRYAQKVLAHTFFARKESVIVTVEEGEMLDAGLKNIIRYLYDYEMRGDTTGNGLVQVWIAHAASYQSKALGKKKDSHHLAIGGMITPILEAVGVKLGEPTADEQFIDTQYLLRGQFLVKDGEGFKYKYNVGVFKEATIKLPCTRLTTLRVRANAAFNLTDEDMETSPTASMETSQQAPPLYGSERYSFDPYDGTSQGEPSRKAHEHIKLLQRWNKWQDRTIRKLVKTVKDMSKQIKLLTAKGEGVSSSRRHEVEEDDEEGDSHMEERRHSFQGAPSEPMQRDEPRPSSHETRRRGKRVARSPTPESSNPSFSMESSSSSTRF